LRTETIIVTGPSTKTKKRGKKAAHKPTFSDIIITVTTKFIDNYDGQPEKTPMIVPLAEERNGGRGGVMGHEEYFYTQKQNTPHE
jgi:hypothetical protein